jgi:hypothetical protein
MDISDAAVDVRVVVGALVVFLIIGAAIFGVYYLLFVRPAAEELEEARTVALSDVDRLRAIGTRQAITAASTFGAQILAADQPDQVDSIRWQVLDAIALEKERKNRLDNAKTVATGAYHTLHELKENLENQINAMTTLADLRAYEAIIYEEATSAWRAYFKNMIEPKPENAMIVAKRPNPVWRILSKGGALAFIKNSDWQELSKYDFENPEFVAIQILDTIDRTLDLRPAMSVDIYVYDAATENLSPIVENAKVLEVIYSSDDIGTIAWTLAYDGVTVSYSTNVWETLKAEAAGRVTGVGWSAYGLDLAERIRTADLGDLDISAMYVLMVPKESVSYFLHYELYGLKDIVLIVPIVPQNTWQYQASQL